MTSLPCSTMTRLRAWILTVWTLLSLSCVSTGLRAESGITFDTANHLLVAGKYDDASKAYEQLTRDGRTSAAIERNWAQACQQAGQPALALLHLRRAAVLAPRDSDVFADLKVLRLKLGVRSGSETDDRSWIRWLSVNEWGWLALAGVWGWCGLGITLKLRPELRTNLGTSFAVTGASATLFTLLAILAWYDFQSLPNAIVLKSDTVLRQSPLDEARPSFVAPASAELRVRDTRPGWVMGEDPGSGRFGWVPQQQLGYVVP